VSAPTSGTRSNRSFRPEPLWQYRGFRALQWLMERLPRGLAYALAVLVARFAFVLARTARRRLEDNLRQVLPEASPAYRDHVLWMNFRNHSKAYADLMRLPRARTEGLARQLELQGVEHLGAARAEGKGVLGVSAHVGSWEVVAAIGAATIGSVSLFA